jgi:hypothetical protein
MNSSVASEVRMRKVRTRAKRVVSPLELLAGCKVFALGCYTLKVVGVVLEAVSYK